MKFHIEYGIYNIIAVILFFNACNASDGERFTRQEAYYTLDLTTSTLTAYGASRPSVVEEEAFRCPTVSGMSSESNLTVFSVQAHALLPHFTLSSALGIRSDAQGGIGISIKNFPVGLLDIYRRCNASSTERLSTSCPEYYQIVNECSPASDNVRECVQIYEGTHELVVSAVMDDSLSCSSEEVDRTSYSDATPEVSYACDAFSPMKLDAAYRGNVPTDNCCNIEDDATLDFCLKPCGCRKLSVKIVPKSTVMDEEKMADALRIAVFSQVGGDKKSFAKLLDSIREHQVDLVVSLGNLTGSGSTSQWKAFKKLIDDNLTTIDGFPSKNSPCSLSDDGLFSCCPSGTDRQFPTVCNAVVSKIPFIAGLGDEEFGGDLDTYNALFGASNLSTTVGKVQIILLDTADGSVSSPEMSWLKGVLETFEKTNCTIPSPQDFDQWPLLAECSPETGDKAVSVTCRACIGEEAYCIVPDKTRSETAYGPKNCVCVPMDADICPRNMWCDRMDGAQGQCVCTRDEDCTSGGTCRNGVCEPPMRLVFSFTPPFDSSGTRNNAFTSKSAAASLMSLFAKRHVTAIFSGKSTDYSRQEMAGIPIYNTGGGGAKMASFSKKGHHWLLVEVPHAYTFPENIKVKTIEF